MEIIKDKNINLQFIKELYQMEPLYITSEVFWEGGIQTDAPLSEKAAFYLLTEKMSAIIKQIVRTYGGEARIGQSFCEHGCVYAKWTDLKNHELFRKLTSVIKKNKCYTISLPEDDSVIDLIVESNFRYFSYISLYLPKVNIILQPTCHTEVLVYSKEKDIIETLERVAQKYSKKSYVIGVKQMVNVDDSLIHEEEQF